MRLLLAITACAEVPTAADPEAHIEPPSVSGIRATISSPTYGNVALDDDVRVELFSSGEIKVTNLISGDTVYVDLDAPEMEIRPGF